jgi:hypothetical protein
MSETRICFRQACRHIIILPLRFQRKNPMKKIVFAVVVLFFAWFFATPYLALRSIKTAAENQDIQTLSQYIDLPALKESLKSSLSVKMKTAIARAHDDNPYGNVFGAAASQFAVRMIDPVLDTAITPETIAMLLQGQGKKSPSSGGSEVSANPLARVFPSTDEETRVSAYYVNFDTFVIAFRNNRTDKERFSFFMKRQGIFSWKIAGVNFPK